MGKSRPFNFKRFTITQECAAMKVGTDAVILGAWCSVNTSMSKTLDIGSGTGVISLMLAQRGERWALAVQAIEPEPGAFEDTKANIAASPWRERITAYNNTLQDFTPGNGYYDLIVCNPPYFTSSLLPPSGQRTTARHDTNLTREELVRYSASLCNPGGRFAVVIPTEQAKEYITECDMKEFTLARRTDVKTRPANPPKRTLLEFVFRPAAIGPYSHTELVIETAPLAYTAEYMALTRDFYLKF